MTTSRSWPQASRRVCAVLAVLLVAGSALARPQDRDDDPAELLESFVHYTLIAKPQLGAAFGQALMESGLSDAELARLLDEEGKTSVERFDSAQIKAQSIKDPVLEQVAGELASRMEMGRQDLAREPERIKQAILMLIGTQRERLLGQRRLEAAGEYAVRDLLLVLTEGKDERLKTQVITMLETIGRQAVTPLTAALPEIGDQVSQRIVCEILGAIAYPHSAPMLKALAEDSTVDEPLREAALRAFARVTRRGWEDMDVSDLYTELAREYFGESESLIAFPYEETNNVWTYDAFVGLQPQPVSTSIFAEVMAMWCGARALEYRPDNEDALTMFVASNLRRENELPAGEVDPIYGELQYTPAFYATVFGTRNAMRVLALALDSVNTPLVRDAIGALAETTGGSNLFALASDRQPLLEGLQYPDRRAQYEAALTLARALPREPFPGDFAIVPLLATAVRTGDQAFALVVADDPEDQRTLANALEDLDFQIVGTDTNVPNLSGAIAEAIGVDLVVVKKEVAQAAIGVVEDLRLIPKTTASPVLIQAGLLDLPVLRPEFRGDRRVLVGRAGGGQFEPQVNAVLDMAAGGRVTEAEAEVYAISALAALRDIAVSRSPAYDINEAESALVEALAIRTGGVRLMVGDILALISSARAQQALWDAALDASDLEQIDLFDRVTESVRNWGDLAEQRHRDALLDLVETASGETAEAAARVHGALNLPPANAVRLIP